MGGVEEMVKKNEKRNTNNMWRQCGKKKNKIHKILLNSLNSHPEQDKLYRSR